MVPIQLNPAQTRVVGSMIEKQLTTPLGYPMTPNAVRVACNQKSNRDPVVEFDDDLIFDTLKSLERLGFVASGLLDNTQTVKYKHSLDSALGLDRKQTVVLCELFNRGPQTPGELRTRCERMHRFADLAEIQTTLDHLVTLGLVQMLERLPGTKEPRWAHRFGPVPAQAPAGRQATVAVTSETERRLDELEARIRRLEERLSDR